MKSLVLVVEHRTCLCGASFTAPNPSLLTKHELDNLRRTNSTIHLPGDTSYRARREILHIDVPISHCQRCFHVLNGRQIELFPDETRFQTTPEPLIFVGIPGAKLKDGGAHVEEKKPPPPNPYDLNYF